MATVFFSGGDTAEITDVQGHDPRTFIIPAASYGTFAEAMSRGDTLKFGEAGEIYLLTQMRGDLGKAVLQTVRR
ncbi:hypothetical protein [Paracoccus alkanivorans]|uniref:Uncharacterized protein n=1 Tax=Paracoccus alkanivorans TaxID=2116655 RepID=A0A3M0MC57_9RHOB|nr:hypothetical protein [Paracoccus alkanivorans]RMC35356.1 hypothetical protein C9E81_08930 [Paracoccus alkanivorans]